MKASAAGQYRCKDVAVVAACRGLAQLAASATPVRQGQDDTAGPRRLFWGAQLEGATLPAHNGWLTHAQLHHAYSPMQPSASYGIQLDLPQLAVQSQKQQWWYALPKGRPCRRPQNVCYAKMRGRGIGGCYQSSSAVLSLYSSRARDRKRTVLLVEAASSPALTRKLLGDLHVTVLLFWIART